MLGWHSKWFPEALKAALPHTRDNRIFKVITAPYFVALKLEAFEERGKGDFLTSTDFEDVICLFNGRATLVDEIASEPKLAKVLANKFTQYLLCTTYHRERQRFQKPWLLFS